MANTLNRNSSESPVRSETTNRGLSSDYDYNQANDW